jgi:murein DD-endopeptidase MepM/ murein hydrolase activator NlpD
MDNKRYHIIILGEDTSEIRRFSVKHKWVRLGLIVFICLFSALLFFGGIWYTDYRTLKHDAVPVFEENSWLQKQNLALRKNAESLHDELRKVTFVFLNWQREAEKRYNDLEHKVSHVARLRGDSFFNKESVGGAGAEQVRLLFHDKNMNAFSAVYSHISRKLDALDGVLSSEEETLINRYVYNRGMRPLWPVRGGHITSYYGTRWDPLTGESFFHNGLDLAHSMGSPIFATERGRVLWSGMAGEYGNLVIIDHGGGFSSRYGHLSLCSVKNGDYVEKGSIIGFLGSTGRSTGPHLHFELRINNETINPLKILR